MADSTALALLKMDLMIATDKMDAHLTQLLDSAMQMITREGITLSGDRAEDVQLQIMYAAYLYRRRAQQDAGAMPRYLRYALNNRLLWEKMRSEVTPLG